MSNSRWFSLAIFFLNAKLHFVIVGALVPVAWLVHHMVLRSSKVRILKKVDKRGAASIAWRHWHKPRKFSIHQTLYTGRFRSKTQNVWGYWPAAFHRFVLAIAVMPRTAPNSAPIISFWFFSSIADLNQLPSHLGIPQPFSKTHKSSTSRSLATLGGFSALAKMDFLARRRGWWLDRQNDSLLSPTRRCNYHWSSVLARRACALLANHQGEPSHTLNVLTSSTRRPPLSWTGLPRRPLRAEGSLTADLSDPGTLSVLPPSSWFLGTFVWHWHEQFQVYWNVLQFNSYQLTCANCRIVQGASCRSWGQHPPCWKHIL